jgi:SAM-dependent methyltransferase
LAYSEAALQRVREDRLLIDRVDVWLYEEIAPYFGQRVLEVGCGLGNFARHLLDRQLYVGIDVSPDSVAHMNEVYESQPNMQAFVDDVTDKTFLDLARFEIDTIFSLNVFEHVQDHVLALRHAKKVLQPGGTLILVVPAHDWLYGSTDRAIGHHRRYNKQSMADLLDKEGLTCVTQKYINALGALGWYFSGRIRKQQTPPSGQLRLFNVLVPFLKRFERILPVPFGISLLTVARKDLKDRT